MEPLVVDRFWTAKMFMKDSQMLVNSTHLPHCIYIKLNLVTFSFITFLLVMKELCRFEDFSMSQSSASLEYLNIQ